jgi:hypothetical protein
MPLKIVMPEGTPEGASVRAGELALTVKNGAITGPDEEVRFFADVLGLQVAGEPTAVVEEAPAPPAPEKPAVAAKANGPKE